METTPQILTLLLPRAPFFIAWAVAILLAVSRSGRHPTASALVVFGGSLGLLGGMAGSLLPLMYRNRGLAQLTLLSGGVTVIGVASLCCLIAAVFVERPAKGPEAGG